MINIFKKAIRKVYSLVSSPYHRKSYSQAGEDAIIDFLFSSIGYTELTYLDLGTNNPSWSNNTYLFYEKGFKGVLVEADKTIIPLIKKIRPRDKTLNLGVSFNDEKEADFYIFNAKALNTFSKDDAEHRQRVGDHKILDIVKVPLETINEIIFKNFDTYPDLISIDIEGLDLDVLNTLDFDKYPVPVICAETCTYSENHIKFKNNSIKDLMHTKGYFVYADTYINTIFVNENWFNK